MKSKEEFMRECENNDKEYKQMSMFQTIAFLVWMCLSIWFCFHIKSEGFDSAGKTLVVFMIVAWLVWIFISVCVIAKRNEFKREYEQYCNGQCSGMDNLHTWTCKCGTVNNNNIRFCSDCGKKRDVEKRNDKPSMDFITGWTCKCGTRNSHQLNFCNNCGEKKVIDYENEWKCPVCGRVNQNYVGTCGCGQVKP